MGTFPVVHLQSLDYVASRSRLNPSPHSKGDEKGGVQMVPTAQALLTMKAESAGTGTTCALLTPAIKARLREMSSGQVLEVRVNDSTAREDVAAWCRLSGNELLAMMDEGPEGLRFFLKKK